MASLRESGFLLWFCGVAVAATLLWPVGFFLVFDDDSSSSLPLTAILALPFFALPFTMPVVLFVAAVVVLPSAFGWWLAHRLTARAAIFWNNAALASGATAIASGLLALALLITALSGHSDHDDNFQPLAGMQNFELDAVILEIALMSGGPVVAFFGPMLAYFAFGNRFPDPQESTS